MRSAPLLVAWAGGGGGGGFATAVITPSRATNITRGSASMAHLDDSLNLAA